jgi:hypothetical protein
MANSATCAHYDYRPTFLEVAKRYAENQRNT